MYNSEQRVADSVLSVQASDIATEIFVIGGALEVLARGVGELRAVLPAGACRVKFRAADEIATEMADLRPGAITRINGRPVRFRSPVPFAVEGQDAALFASEVNALLEERRIHWGGGGGLAFLLRCDKGVDVVPPTICRVMSPSGERLASLLEPADRFVQNALAMKLSVEPGMYRVQFDEGAGWRTELPIAAVRGWTSLVCGVVHRSSEGAPYVRTDEISVQALPDGKQLRLDSSSLRVAELSRLAMSLGRTAVAESVLMRGTELAKECPLGLLYAVAALLGRRNRRREQLAESGLDALDTAGFRTPDSVLLRARLAAGAGTRRRPKCDPNDLMLVANRNWMIRHYGGARAGLARRGAYAVQVGSSRPHPRATSLGVAPKASERKQRNGSFAAAFRRTYELLNGDGAATAAARAQPITPLEAYVYSAAATTISLTPGRGEDAAALSRRARQVASAIPVPAAELAEAAQRLVRRMT